MNLRYFLFYFTYIVIALAINNASGEDFELTVLHINDIHSRIEQTNERCGVCKLKDQGQFIFILKSVLIKIVY